MKEIIYVGIDVSKYKHDICIISNTGEVIIENDNFENNKKGFQKFFDLLKSYDKSAVQIIFEATGNYSLNLELELTDQDYSYMKMNPLVVKQFLKARSLRRTKTDKADALTLVQFLMSTTYKPNSMRLYHIYSLKSLCRTRDKLVKERSKFKVFLTNELDKSFPEMKEFFDNKISVTFLYVLEKYRNKNKIALMKDYDSIRKVSGGSFTPHRFFMLKELAKNSIGHPTETSDVLIETYVNSIKCFNREIDEIESKIAECMKNIDTHLMSIPGVGPVSAATIISEFGDIENFESPAKMLAFAGLEPGIYQSGTMLRNGKMVKHGSGYLRYTIIQLTNSLTMHNSVFYDYYSKKKAEGKHHRVAQSHLAKKLVRLIYTLETKKIDFDNDLLK